MATTVEEIRSWLERGKEMGATHVIVVCDTYDHDDYPVFVKPNENCREKAAKYDGKDMQKVMEVYSLSLNWDYQLDSSRRVFNYD